MSRLVSGLKEWFETLLFGDRCDLRGCGRPYDGRTRCCRRRLCESHAHRWQADAAANGCPIPGCRK